MSEDPTHLKVVGEIKPPNYKDPAKMLRAIAECIEKGDYGSVSTIVVAIHGEDGIYTFGGGMDSDLKSCAFVFSSSALRLHQLGANHVG